MKTIEMLSQTHKAALTELLVDMTKDTLVAYASSHGLKVSGTKYDIVERILDSNSRTVIRMLAPPSGTISIGIALEND